MHRTPWSTRSTPSTSIASQTNDGGPSSPACATRWKPSSAAAANAGANRLGGWPTSVESSPTPAIVPRWGSSDCTVSRAASGPRCRTTQAISATSGPPPAALSRAAQVRPDTHLVQRYAAGRVLLRVEEHLRPHHAVRASPGQVGRREVVEVLRGAEHRHAGVVEVEERLQVAEGVGALQRRDVGERQPDAVARRELEGELRLERALDVDVQLGLGQPGDERAEHGRSQAVAVA